LLVAGCWLLVKNGQQQKQIPCGDDKPIEARANTGVLPLHCVQGQDDGKDRQRQKQIPPLRCGMTISVVLHCGMTSDSLAAEHCH
jgi:hypothetical protein